MAGDGSGARINVLVNLNARVEARDGAGILGVVPANTCIVADVCQEASDGVWCRARFGEDFGWLKKVALRQERWPVLTFTNQCVE
jgi:SH3-like domain-containing protein